MARRKSHSYGSVRGYIPYAVLIVFLVIISVLARAFFDRYPHVTEEIDFQLLVLGGLLFIGFYINRIAPKTIIPSFVWAIFAGLALQPLLSVFTGDIGALSVTMEIFAAIILFSGGLEIPFKNFKKWFFPIASLSLIGVMASSVLFAVLLYGLVSMFGTFDPIIIPSIIILSAALASSDPTAIIPTLKNIHFKKPALKQIVIAESALTDVTGSVLTRFLLLALITVDLTAQHGVLSYFTPLLQKSTYDALALQIISGILVGFAGYLVIKRFYRGSKSESSGSDPALMISVPIVTFVVGNILGGAGLLAAFVSGLLSDVVGGIKKASHFYDSFLNHLIKPVIFIALGALVPIDVLLALAPLGIISALVFMFIVRPFVVFVSLLPWFHKNVFGFRDFLFLSFIRETGIIAAVMIIIAAASPIIVPDFIIAIGMWIILLTLIIEPPLTPYFAKKIGVLREK